MTRTACARRVSTMRRRLPALAAVFLVTACLLVAAPAAAAVPRRCPTPSAPQPIIADIPWPQQRYDLPAVSQITDAAGVTVAVVDSGVDRSAPQLTLAVSAGADLLDPTGDGTRDCVGHGTAVASIIAARPAPGVGLRGLAPGARIFPVRVSERIDPAGGPAPLSAGTVADLAAGIRAATASRPRPAVINLSITTTVDNPALHAAVDAALAADIVVVAAVGNEHERGDPRPYPAAYDGVIGVGAIGPDLLRVPSSQVGPYVDLVAPGAGVVGAAPGGGQRTIEGTSFATPFVTATAALIRARWPRLHRAEVARRLLATADRVPGPRPSPQYGYGVVNPMRALTELLPGPPGGAFGNDGAPAGGARPGDGGPGTGGVPAPRTGSRSTAAAPGAAAGPDPLVVGSAVLVAATAMLAAVAAALPAGRRRRWRPGRPAARPAEPATGRFTPSRAAASVGHAPAATRTSG